MAEIDIVLFMKKQPPLFNLDTKYKFKIGMIQQTADMQWNKQERIIDMLAPMNKIVKGTK